MVLRTGHAAGRHTVGLKRAGAPGMPAMQSVILIPEQTSGHHQPTQPQSTLGSCGLLVGDPLHPEQVDTWSPGPSGDFSPALCGQVSRSHPVPSMEKEVINVEWKFNPAAQAAHSLLPRPGSTAQSCHPPAQPALRKPCLPGTGDRALDTYLLFLV